MKLKISLPSFLGEARCRDVEGLGILALSACYAFRSHPANRRTLEHRIHHATGQGRDFKIERSLASARTHGKKISELTGRPSQCICRWQEENSSRTAGTMGEVQGSEEMMAGVVRRNLRVTKWISTTPAIGVCAACNQEFKVPVSAMKRVSDAQAALRDAFAQHECEPGSKRK